MAEPVELTKKIKELYNNELDVVTYVGTGREGEPVYMLSKTSPTRSCCSGLIAISSTFQIQT